MQINDRILGLLALLGGIAILLGTRDFVQLRGQQFGSAFFPRILGGVVIALGLILVVKPDHGRWLVIGDLLKGRAGLQVLLTLASVVLWVWVAPLTGFVIATAALIAGLAWMAGGRPLPALATGLVMALVLFAVFGLLLRVPLPQGPIEAVLR